MKSQKGFTLIELIVVIVILGVLAATALPKFVNMSTDARIAVLNGIKGSAASAAAMAYGKAAIAGANLTSASGQSVTINGSSIDLVYGYPDAADINTLLSDSGGATFATGVWTLQTSCTLTYVNAASATAAPTYTTVTTGC